MTFSKIFFYFCLSFILGVFIGSIIFIPQFYLLGFLFFGALMVLIFLFKKCKRTAVIGLCLMFFLIGAWRYQTNDFNIKNNNLKQYNDQEFILAGKILT